MLEINAALTRNSIDNVDSIAAEINDIEKWFEENGINKLDEKKALLKAQKLIQDKYQVTN